jgi:flagellar biosynthesis protein FlhG
MPDQAEKLRQLNHTLTTPHPYPALGPPMIVVTSGRAGMGASTVAANLASVLADWGDRVLLVDAAAEGNALAKLAGVNASKSDFALSSMLDGQCSATKAISPGPGGAMLLANRCGRGKNPDTSRRAQQRLLAELQSLYNDFDLVVLDIGSGLTHWTRRFWLQAQLVLLVTTTDASALMDSYATIKMSIADGIGPDVRLVVNACDDDRLAAETHRRISDACSRFLGRSLPALPALARFVAEADTSQMPRVWEAPNSTFGHSVMWLARAAHDALRPAPPTPAATCRADLQHVSELSTC